MKAKLCMIITAFFLAAAISACNSNNDIKDSAASSEQRDNGIDDAIVSQGQDDNTDETDYKSSQFNGFIESVDIAILKKSKAHYTLISSRADHWMTLENNSSDSIHITGARVIVDYYEPIPSEGYVVMRAGDGNSFDPYWGLYSEIGSTVKSYPAYRVELDDSGYMIDGTVNWDPVFNEDLAANDSRNIRFFVEFQEPGIYEYKLIIDFNYNGKEKHVSYSSNILYDNNSDYIENGIEEYFEHFDEYNS